MSSEVNAATDTAEAPVTDSSAAGAVSDFAPPADSGDLFDLCPPVDEPIRLLDLVKEATAPEVEVLYQLAGRVWRARNEAQHAAYLRRIRPGSDGTGSQQPSGEDNALEGVTGPENEAQPACVHCFRPLRRSNNAWKDDYNFFGCFGRPPYISSHEVEAGPSN